MTMTSTDSCCCWLRFGIAKDSQKKLYMRYGLKEGGSCPWIVVHLDRYLGVLVMTEEKIQEVALRKIHGSIDRLCLHHLER